MGQHYLSYRRFFAHPRMIRDLLRKIVDEPWVEKLDLGSAELANTSFVSGNRGNQENRDSDIIWRSTGPGCGTGWWTRRPLTGRFWKR